MTRPEEPEERGEQPNQSEHTRQKRGYSPQGASADVMDIRAWCRSFPALPTRPIERLNLLDELEDAFARGTHLIVLEGEDGKGKTALLAQFALRHPLQTVGLFARPTSSLTYDPQYLLTDLCEQLHWLVYSAPREARAEPPDEGEYGRLLTRLEGHALYTRQPYYFLVDGLEEIPPEGIVMRDQLLQLVQFGLKSFHFLYAGHAGALGRLPLRVRNDVAHMQFPLPRFTLNETERYLADLGLSEGDIRQLFDLTHGLPGHLAVVQRVLVDGLPVERLMADLPTELSGLFDLQWEAIAAADPGDADLLKDLLALLAHDRGYHTLGSLARLTDVSNERVEALLKPLGFLRLGPAAQFHYDGVGISGGNPPAALPSTDMPQTPATAMEIGGATPYRSAQDTLARSDTPPAGEQEVAFVPETFRTYAARRLASRTTWARERVVADLALRPLSVEALTRLPSTLEEMNRVDELIRYLSPDYFAALVSHQRPLSQALAAAARGLHIAGTAHRDINMAQLSLTRALLLELARGGVDTEEVEAYLALGEEDRAFTLALSAPLVEDRLELLATIAKVRRITGMAVDPALNNQIEQLAAQIDPEALGERARDLGMTLLFSLPAVGLRFLERAETDETEGEQREDAIATRSPIRRALAEADPDLRDWLDAVGDTFGEAPERTETRETFEALRASLSESAAGRLSTVLSALYGQQSAEELLDALREIPRPQDQIYVLGHWLRRNATRSDAPHIVDEALDRILRHSDTAMPDARIFRDIAEPLPRLADPQEAARLIGRFDTFADLIERQSPSRDYVRLQVWLARAECRYDATRASDRLLQVWLTASELADLVERAACVAQVVAALDPIATSAREAGQPPPLPEQDVRDIKASLDPLIEELLATCADQYHATRGVIRALAPRQPGRALVLAGRLNTYNRRLAATFDVLRLAVQGISLETIAHATDTLDQGLEKLRGTVRGDVILLWIAESAAALAGAGETRRRQGTLVGPPDDVELTAIARLLPYLEMCREMVGARRRCRALALWEVALRRLMIRWSNLSISTPPRSAASEEDEGGDGYFSPPEDAHAVGETTADPAGPVRSVGAHKLPSGPLPRGPLTPIRLAHLVAQTAEQVDSTWELMDPGWRTITLGFEIVRLLASDDPQRARQYLQQAGQKRRDMRIPAAHVMGPYAACLSLVVRAYAGLLDLGLQTEQDRAQLSRIIDALPGYGERVAMWAEVAVRCFFHQQETLGRDIVTTHIYRLLELIAPQDTLLLRWAITAAAPALYLAHHETARDWIGRVAPEYRASIYAQIAQMLITRCPPGDPFTHASGSSRPLSYPEVLDVCRLIEDINHDGHLFNTVAWLADGIVAGRVMSKLSREQQRQVAARVRNIVETHLPDPRNIEHEGYKVIALAQVARIDAATATQREAWTPLAEAARKIPNVSDRAFVMAHLAVTTPNISDRQAWLDEAEALIAGIPARRNRLEDYAALAHLVLGSNWGEGGASQARAWLRKAMATAAEASRDSSMYSAQRHLIDLAYQFDEPLARELAKQIDDDPARLAQRLRALDLKKRLADATSGDPAAGAARGHGLGIGGIDTDNRSGQESPARGAGIQSENKSDNKHSEGDDKERLYALVEACQMHLAALDAGRLPTVSIEHLREPLAAAAQLPLSEAYPIYVWALENAVRRLSGAAAQVQATLHPLFEAVAQVTELTPRLEEDEAARVSRAARVATRTTSSSDVELSTHIRPGERDKAEQVLREWCVAHPSPSLTLSDRYFSPPDLRWVRVLVEAMPPGCRITVLTSRRGQTQAHVETPWETTYKQHWRLGVRQGDPPPIEIVILGTAKDGQAPFHDRCLIGAGAGLHLGVSFNALGGASDTIISALTSAQAEDTERDLVAWARGGAWEYKGERLLRTVFRLDDPDL